MKYTKEHNDIFKWPIVKKLIFLEAISYDKCTDEYLKRNAYIKFGDIAIIFRILQEQDGPRYVSTVITKDMMHFYKKSEADLYEVGYRNYKLVGSPILAPLESILKGTPPEEVHKKEKYPVYELSCHMFSYGACAMFYPGILRKFSDKMGCDIYVIPDSVDEVLLVAAVEENDPKILYERLRLINEANKKDGKFLSNLIYVYKRDENQLKICPKE